MIWSIGELKKNIWKYVVLIDLLPAKKPLWMKLIKNCSIWKKWNQSMNSQIQYMDNTWNLFGWVYSLKINHFYLVMPIYRPIMLIFWFQNFMEGSDTSIAAKIITVISISFIIFSTISMILNSVPGIYLFDEEGNKAGRYST